MGGILYGVGVGPGDPELITLKALRCIEGADILVLPAAAKEECHAYRIARNVCPHIEKKEVVCLPFPMSFDRQELADAHDQICRRIEAYLQADRTVAFLTIGDPSVYSTYSYIHKRVLGHGGRAQMISGVPSFCAAAAALSVPLAESGEQIHVIPASYETAEGESLAGTRIYMKSGKKLGRLKRILERESRTRELAVYCVENCGMENEKRMAGIESLDDASGYLTLVIVKETGQNV